MSVLRVTAHMAAPIAAVDAICLDAILVGAHPDAVACHPTRTSPLPDLLPLPLARIHTRGHLVYIASGWQFPDETRLGRETFTKRRDPEDIDWLEAPFTPSSGPGKNYQIPLMTIETPRVQWMAVGDRRGVKKLLRYARAVGGYRRQGYGAVSGWDIETVDAHPLSCLVEDGVAMRYLPRAWLASADMTEQGACLPPYWHPGRVVERVRPGWRCELHADVARLVGTQR